MVKDVMYYSIGSEVVTKKVIRGKLARYKRAGSF